MAVALRIRQTLGAVDIHPAQELKGVPEVLLINWVEAQGSRKAVRLGRAPVAMEVGTGEECQGRAREEAVGNTGVPEVVVEVL